MISISQHFLNFEKLFLSTYYRYYIKPIYLYIKPIYLFVLFVNNTNIFVLFTKGYIICLILQTLKCIKNRSYPLPALLLLPTPPPRKNRNSTSTALLKLCSHGSNKLIKILSSFHHITKPEDPSCCPHPPLHPILSPQTPTVKYSFRSFPA